VLLYASEFHFKGAAEPENDDNEPVLPVPKFPRSPRAQCLPENETQIEGTDVDQLPLENIFAASEINPSQCPGFAAVRE
jgi:hypothetical protein